MKILNKYNFHTIHEKNLRFYITDKKDLDKKACFYVSMHCSENTGWDMLDIAFRYRCSSNPGLYQHMTEQLIQT